MTNYCCVHVSAEYELSEDGWFLQGEMTGWNGFWHRLFKDGRTRGSEFAGERCGNLPYSFWSWIRANADEGGTDLTVYGWKIWPMFCVADGKREIAEGRLILDVSEDGEDIFIAANPPTVIKMHTPEGVAITFIDLSNFGIELGDYPAKSLPIKGKEGESILLATRQAVNDLHSLTSKYGMGPTQTTAASQAWTCYVGKHQPQPPAVPPSPEQSPLEEAAYFGGRCECGRLGQMQEELYHLDVSAMYTAIGLTAMFPRVCTATTSSPNERPWSWQKGIWIASEELASWKNQLMIADVTIRTDKPYYPADSVVCVNHSHVPDADRGERRIIYPIGTFRTVLCGPELALAVGEGHIKEWHKVQYYEPAPLMAEWSKWALAMREDVKNGNLAHVSRAAKKIINSLPGKWGQREKVWRDVEYVNRATGNIGKASADEWFQEWGNRPEGNGLVQFRTIAGKTQYLDMDKLHPQACPAVAAFWTSYGRAYLLTLIECAGWENVYYYVTDSLIVNKVGMVRLLNAQHIMDADGKLRIVEVASDCKILGVNRYFMNGKWHIAGGIADDATEEGFSKQMWQHHFGRPVKEWTNADSVQAYRHGIVGTDGRVSPFKVGK